MTTLHASTLGQNTPITQPAMSKLEAEQHLNRTLWPVPDGVEWALERRASQVNALMYPTWPRVESVGAGGIQACIIRN